MIILTFVTHYKLISYLSDHEFSVRNPHTLTVKKIRFLVKKSILHFDIQECDINFFTLTSLAYEVSYKVTWALQLVYGVK